MSDEEKLESLLSKNAREVFDGAAAGEHISDERLAAEPIPALSKEEIAHLSRCAECRAIVAERARTPEAQNVIRLDTFRRRLVSVLAVAAAIAFGSIFIGRDPYRSKGNDDGLGAEVTLIAINAAGERRDVRSGDEITAVERLGFKYGNPDGKYQTVTILGWDGREVHWYYPEKEGHLGQPISATQGTGERLPFDVGLEDHAQGKLKVVVSFDADPSALARALEQGTTPRRTQVFELELSGGAK